METEENHEETEEEKRFREIYYSSLLEQRQENETNQIKIALFAIGATIAGVAGTVKALEPFSKKDTSRTLPNADLSIPIGCF